MPCRHKGWRVRRRKYGGRWQDTLPPDAPPAKQGETVEQWKKRTHLEPGWRPYCLVCSTMGRMTRTKTGFRCEGKGDHFMRPGCGNEIGPDLRRHP